MAAKKQATVEVATSAAAKTTTATKTAPAKKSVTAAKKTPPSKAEAAKKAAPAKRSASAAKTAPAKTAPAKTSARKTVAKLAVREGETAWTAAEIAEVRAALVSDATRLEAEISAAETEIGQLLREGGEGAGNDQADVGSNTFERDHEMSMAKNARANLELVQEAVKRIDVGTYGVCESCGNPIGKMRLQAFPRATLCMECKQRQERR
jgi:RNA polymerase-binding protein DksA